MHAGGVLADSALRGQTAASLRAVLAPKACGVANLDTALSASPLQAAVAFSSIAALLGNPGQANYAAANGALDAWAHSSCHQVSCLGALSQRA